MLVFIYNTDKTSEIDLFDDEDKDICLQMVHSVCKQNTALDLQGAYVLRVDNVTDICIMRNLHNLREKAKSPGIFVVISKMMRKVANKSHAWGFSQRLEEHDVKPWQELV